MSPARTRKKPYTRDEVAARMCALAEALGGQDRAAAAMGLSPQGFWNIAKGGGQVRKAVLDYFGLEKKVLFYEVLE